MKELQARIESTRFRGGYTLTAMAMRKALKLYTKAERQDGDTAKVKDNEEKRRYGLSKR